MLRKPIKSASSCKKNGPEIKVGIQVIKVYDIDVPDDCDDPIEYAYDRQTTEIEATGKLIDAMTDHAETREEIETNRQFLDK